jgi:hypothetical protein
MATHPSIDPLKDATAIAARSSRKTVSMGKVPRGAGDVTRGKSNVGSNRTIR